MDEAQNKMKINSHMLGSLTNECTVELRTELVKDMSKSVNGDLLGQYKTITTKLRKRFLRKPNVAEASDEFSSLALQSERAHSLEFSGLCWLGAAKCEGSLGSAHSEIEALLKAARLFLKSESFNQSIGCCSAGHENINAALNCYHHAVCRFRDNSPMSFAAHIEARNVLGDQLTKEIDCNIMKTFNPVLTLSTLSSKVKSLVERGNYLTALEVLTEMDNCTSSSIGVYRDILIRNEVTKLLLLLLLEPPIARLTASQAKLIEKYSWTDFDDANEGVQLSGDLALHLHALVAAWQSKDMDSMNDIRPKLASHMTPTQKLLLARLATIHSVVSIQR